MRNFTIHVLAASFFFSIAGAGICEVYPSHYRFFSRVTDREIDEGKKWQVFSDWSRWEEEGRTFLSEIERERFAAGAGLLLPGGVHLELESIRWTDSFLDIPGAYDAEGSGFRAKAPLLDNLSLSVASEKKDYEKPEADDSSSLGIALDLVFGESASMTAAFRRREEVYNFYGLIQGIEADSWGASLVFGKSVKLAVESEFLDYNDGNETMRSAVSLSGEIDAGGTLTPRAEVEYRDAQRRSLLLFIPGGGVLGITHPYWAPREYTSASLGLDYELDYADSCAVSVGLAAIYDTDEEAAVDASLGWKHKFIVVQGRIFRSDVWDAEGISLKAQFAF